MQYLAITQGPYGTYSHSTKNAMDICGSGTGIDNVMAPFTGTVKAIDSVWGAVWLESNTPVTWADGTVDYLTILTLHDNDISNLWVGKTIAQGEIYCQEGVKSPDSNVTGNHVHLECIRGQVGSSKWNARGNVYAYDALFLTNQTIIINTLGYSWRTLPSTPGSITVSSASKIYAAQDVLVNWTTTANASRYGITVRKYPYTGPESIVYDNGYLYGTQANIGKLPVGSYRFAMAAYNSVNVMGPVSNIFYFDVINNPSLSAPKNLTATGLSNGSVQLKWDSVVNASAYDIYRSMTSIGGYTLLASTTSTTYTNAGLKAATKYYYKVKAKIYVGSSTFHSAPSIYAGSITAPGKPTNLSVTSLAAGTKILYWTPVTGARGYAIYRASSLLGTYTIQLKTTNTAIQFASPPSGTTYYYKVKAFTIYGDTTVYGYPSTPLVIKN